MATESNNLGEVVGGCQIGRAVILKITIVMGAILSWLHNK